MEALLRCCCVCCGALLSMFIYETPDPEIVNPVYNAESNVKHRQTDNGFVRPISEQATNGISEEGNPSIMSEA